MNSSLSLTRQIERETASIEKAVNNSRDERMAAVARQAAALELYEEEMRQLEDLEAIDRELGR
jgi:hypothetical protein